MVGLATKHVVGYEVSVLLGSNARDEIVDKVFRTELVFSILLASYSTFLFGLAFVKGLFRRLKVLALGAGIPLLGLLLLFWVKFLSDDHIISSGEKTELFLLSIIGVSIGVALCWFGMFQLSRKPKISLDDFELPSEVSENMPSDDLLDELKERDRGEGGDGIESEQTESSTTAAEEVAEVVPEPLPEALSEEEAPEPIDEALEAQPVIDEDEDVQPPPLPELAEEPLEESIEEELVEVVPEPSTEALYGEEVPEPIDETSEAQPVIDETEDVQPPPLPELAKEPLEEFNEEELVEVVSEPSTEATHSQAVVSKRLASAPSELESESPPPPEIDEKVIPSTLDHAPRKVEGGEPSPSA
ncbi:MAG: hypothetical protein HN727_04050 [Opitutae bacterium]|nr:hypothetical protein [Opitutae bacterium]